MVRNNKRIPLYLQIREYITDQIQNKVWLAGDRLPSENDLVTQFKVSRITVKNALSKLIEEGVIFRIQGKGSFVSPDVSGEPMIYEFKHGKNTKHQLVAFLIPRLSNTFTARLLDSIETELALNGYRVIFCKTHDSQELEKQILREMIQLDVKGIIIFPVEGESYSEEILRMNLNHFPFVVVDRYFRGIETNSVCTDNFEGARMATDMLISLGHRQIGFISNRFAGTTSIEDRLAGYERALADCGIAIEHRLRIVEFEAEQVNTILDEGIPDEQTVLEIQDFISRNPDMTAIFALNPAFGLTTIKAIMGLNLRVPEDISVIFFDNYEMSTLSTIPPTYVGQEEREIGKEAVRLLVSVINDPRQDRRKILLPPRLIVRGSTAPRQETAPIKKTTS